MTVRLWCGRPRHAVRALRHRRRFALALTVCALALASATCGSSQSGEPLPGPRRAMLHDLTDVVILPTYAALVSETSGLARAGAALRDAPDAETLAAMRAAWRAARHPWKQSEAFRFGPSESLQLRIRTKLDWWPPNEERIEEEIAGSAVLTAEYIDGLGVNKRGFAALEYLLFDAIGDPDTVLATLTGATGQRRRQFIAAVAADMAVQSQRLFDAWSAGRGGRGEATGATGRHRASRRTAPGPVGVHPQRQQPDRSRRQRCQPHARLSLRLRRGPRDEHA
jgi:predicted lipoprotein